MFFAELVESGRQPLGESRPSFGYEVAERRFVGSFVQRMQLGRLLVPSTTLVPVVAYLCLASVHIETYSDLCRVPTDPNPTGKIAGKRTKQAGGSSTPTTPGRDRTRPTWLPLLQSESKQTCRLCPSKTSREHCTN